MELPTSANMSPEEFAAKLGDTGLLLDEEIQSAMDTLSGGTSIVDGQRLAKQLVRDGKLTTYQAAAVLEARGNELRVGNYDLLEKLGAGAMGTVYKARHRRMKRIVALKVLSRSLAKDTFIKRFQREIETLAQLTHTNIVMAYDADEAEVGPFLVMEFVDGKDLASIVQQSGPMDLAAALDALLQAARGLDYAHKKSIIHRDIKPANIMRNASGVVKVADLGLARLNAQQDTVDMSSLTQAGGIVGTMDYMAPEQAIDSTAVDHRADIYSLGCTLFFILNARPMYQGNSIMSILLKHRDAPIPSLSANRQDVPAELEGVFQRMVAKKVDERYQNMADVVAALETIHAHLTPAPSPPRALEETLVAGNIGELASVGASSSDVRRVADRTVVLVEPSRTQAGIIRRFLEELGIKKIHVFGAGGQAIDLVKRERVDVIISSMHLSDMTGMALVQALRADPACASVGFVLTTSGSESDDLTSLQAMPHTVLMPKPFDTKKLAESISAATGRF